MKKLKLNREVLRQLGCADTERVQGGTAADTDFACLKAPVKDTRADCAYTLRCPSLIGC